MSLLDTAGRAADEHMDDWVDKLLDRAGKLLDDAAPVGPPGLGSLSHEAGAAALIALEGHKDDLARLGRFGAAFALAAFGAGETEEQILTWLRQGATFEERLKAQADATSALSQATAEREAAWDSLKKTLQDVGRVAVRYVVPFLVAALAAL